MAAEGEFDVGDDGAFRQVENVGKVDAGFESDVVNGAGFLVVEMAVFLEIRAEAGRFAVKIDLTDDAVLDERLEAVVDGRQRDARDAFLNSHENLVGGRVVTLLHEQAIGFPALTGHFQAANLRRHVAIGRGVKVAVCSDHDWIGFEVGGKLERFQSRARIILIFVLVGGWKD